MSRRDGRSLASVTAVGRSITMIAPVAEVRVSCRTHAPSLTFSLSAGSTLDHAPSPVALLDAGLAVGDESRGARLTLARALAGGNVAFPATWLGARAWRRAGALTLGVSLSSYAAASRSARATPGDTVLIDSRLVIDTLGGGAGHWVRHVVIGAPDSSTALAARVAIEGLASARWERGALQVEGGVGARLAQVGVASGAVASIDARMRVGSRAALLLGVGNTARGGLAPGDGRAWWSLGVSILPPRRVDRPAARPRRLAARTFQARRVDALHQRVRVCLPGANRGELAGDFSAWRAVAMERAGACWEQVVALAAGLHRLNVRVDGGPWAPPPGLPVEAGTFGDVGLLVVDE